MPWYFFLEEKETVNIEMSDSFCKDVSGKLVIPDWLTGEKKKASEGWEIGKKCAQEAELTYILRTWGYMSYILRTMNLQGSLPLSPMTPDSLGMMKMNVLIYYPRAPAFENELGISAYILGGISHLGCRNVCVPLT